MADVYVVRNVRISLNLDTEIRRIAEFEDRTISKTIQRLLQCAVNNYLEIHEQDMLYHEELSAQRFHDIEEEADEIAETLDKE